MKSTGVGEGALGVDTLLIGPGGAQRHPDPDGQPARGRPRPHRQRRRGHRGASAGPCIIISSARPRTSTPSRANGEYVGGVLAPGVAISMEALFDLRRAAGRASSSSHPPRARNRRDGRARAAERASSTGTPARWTASSGAWPPSSATAPACSRPAGLAGLIVPHAETVDEHVPDLTL